MQLPNCSNSPAEPPPSCLKGEAKPRVSKDGPERSGGSAYAEASFETRFQRSSGRGRWELQSDQSRPLAPRARRGYIPANGDHLLLRRGSDRRAKDNRALRLDPRAGGRHARAIQSLAKNQARRNGFPDRAWAARRTGPIDDRTKREGAGKTSARVHRLGGGPPRSCGAAHACRESARCASAPPYGTKPSGGSRRRLARPERRSCRRSRTIFDFFGQFAGRYPSRSLR